MISLALVFTGASTALAAPAAADQPGSSDQLEEIYVTATKKSAAEELQKVPLAVAAFTDKMLEAQQFRAIKDLTYNIPNVKIDTIGSFPTYASVAIRGFSTTTSVPSIDPTVGIFVDGMYEAIAAGAISDTFDVADIEVLRGPQGILFGRNVTGGALTVNTREPEDEFGVRMKVNAETDPLESVAAAVTGPIVKGVLDARFVGYFKNDNGYFSDPAPSVDRHVGEQRTYFLRPSFKFTPTDRLKMVLRVEYGKNTGDGSPAQQRGTIAGGFDSLEGDPGFQDVNYLNAITTTDYRVGFGDGVVTNVLGYRKVFYTVRTDVSGLPTDIAPFVAGASPPYVYNTTELARQHQISNELRYNGTFFGDRLNTTEGLYFLHDNLFYMEAPILLQVNNNGGGDQSRTTYGVFTADDFQIVDKLTLNSGLRFTQESKEASIAVINHLARCNLETGSCSGTDYYDSHTWESWSPKVGLTWQALPNTTIYGYWARAQRSGGYNLRTTTPNFSVFGPETDRTFELGVKSQFLDNRIRLNIAAFDNLWKGMQQSESRSTNQGSISFFANGADAITRGIEAELTAVIAEGLILNASVGNLHAHYTTVLADLNGDKVINAKDYQLKLPFAAPWTASIGGSYSHPLPADVGSLVLRTNYSYRDTTAFNVSNANFLPTESVVDASIAWAAPGGRWTVTAYGKNLADKVQADGITTLPNPFAGVSLGPRGKNACTCFLDKGRIFGVEFAATY